MDLFRRGPVGPGAQDRTDQSPANTRSADDDGAPSRGSGGGTSPSIRREDSDEPGQPTERVQMTQGAASARLDPEDPADLLDPAKSETTPEPPAPPGSRSTPGNQRQMFAPGRDSREAGRQFADRQPETLKSITRRVRPSHPFR